MRLKEQLCSLQLLYRRRLHIVSNDWSLREQMWLQLQLPYRAYLLVDAKSGEFTYQGS
jgi:hypothetical protein